MKEKVLIKSGNVKDFKFLLITSHNPKAKSIMPTDEFTLNKNYSSKFKTIKINSLQKKETVFFILSLNIFLFRKKILKKLNKRSYKNVIMF